MLEILCLIWPFSTAFDMQIPSVGDSVKGETSGAIGSVLSVSVEDITGDSSSGSFFPLTAFLYCL